MARHDQPCEHDDVFDVVVIGAGIAGLVAAAKLQKGGAKVLLLEQHEIVERRLYTDHPPRAEYLLTEKGRALKPILEAYTEWGNSYRPSTELQ